ncbi:MAG: HAMP domain-containing histidine kinase [Bacteroidetes bacterium]|nr:HAMP domain-containing histidine kinase [Bacteroidota bacterium]
MRWFNKPGQIILAAALAIILLLLFQINWLKKSQKLVEEQFDQKVTMALCSAIDELGNKEQPINIDFLAPPGIQECRSPNLRSDVSGPNLASALNEAMSRYQIDLKFDFDVIPATESESPPAVYCSTLQPLAQEDHSLRVQFYGKDDYVFQQLGFMAGSSLLLLLILCSLFALTVFRLIHQRRLHAVSVDVFNSMAHEFRTPITNISLALNRALKKTEGGDTRYLNIIKTENERLQRQIESMLHVARIDRGEFTCKKEEIDLSNLVSEVVRDLRFRIEEKQAVVEIVAPDNLPGISGDSLHISNAVRNLVDNALKYCPTGCSIQIALEQDGPWQHLIVSDNGPGMDTVQAQRAFEPFMQNSDRQKGFGLGLYYVRQIVEQHKGQITIDPNPGNGTRVRIKLPQTPAYES